MSTLPDTASTTCGSRSGPRPISISASPAIASVAGERLVFRIRSHTDPTVFYRVDLEADYYRGQCDCRWFECHVAPARREDPTRIHECKHIQEAVAFFGRRVLREIRKVATATYGTAAKDVGPS